MERILLVESDPDIQDLIAYQVLPSLSCQVEVAENVTTAIQYAMEFSPDMIISEINLPDLSAKDLLVALSSQGIEVPVILITEEGMEVDIIQAFHLGAIDTLNKPLREAEIVSAVERTLLNLRSRREREQLVNELTQANEELKQHLGDLTNVISLGKAFISITDLHRLFDQIIEDVVQITGAQRGWLLIREIRNRPYNLKASVNLPQPLASLENQPFNDGLSQYAAHTGKILAVHGESLQRFRISKLGKAALVVPMNKNGDVIGLIVVVRTENKPFSQYEQTILDSLSDFATTAVINARMMHSLEELKKEPRKVGEGEELE